MSEQHGNLLDHEYDGIREYDNPTPGWWHALLWGTIGFALCYIVYAHFSIFNAPLPARWELAQQDYFERLFGEVGTLEPDEATILGMAADAKWMSLGASIYTGNCAQCHGADGGGLNGPNLTDDSWIHVKRLEDLYTTISDGVAAKGMPAWKTRLGQNQRVLVASYVSTLRGTRPALPKAAEGEPIAPWPGSAAPRAAAGE